MEEFILQNLNTYGPFAVFLLLMGSGMGLPLGEDVIIIPAGALVADGHMAWWPTLAWTWIGVVLSDTLWYLICHRFGTRLLHMRWTKRLIHPRRLLEAKHQLERRGLWLIVIARFIPGSRTYANSAAGMFHMPAWKFIVATAGPTCITAPAQLGIGYLIGSHISSDNVGHMMIKIFGIVMLVLAATFVLNVYIAHRRSKQRAPRARAAWLRKFRRITTRRPMSNRTQTNAAASASNNQHPPTPPSPPASDTTQVPINQQPTDLQTKPNTAAAQPRPCEPHAFRQTGIGT